MGKARELLNLLEKVIVAVVSKVKDLTQAEKVLRIRGIEWGKQEKRKTIRGKMQMVGFLDDKGATIAEWNATTGFMQV